MTVLPEIRERIKNINAWFDYIYDQGIESKTVTIDDILVFKKHINKIDYLVAVMEVEEKK